MPPYGTDVNVVEKHESNARGELTAIKATRSIVTLLTHIIVGIIVGISLIFGLRNGAPANVTNIHIILCVIGVSVSFILSNYRRTNYFQYQYNQ
jgi:hypothetical protein